MISERNRGLFALSIVVQLILSQGLFWLYYLGFSTLYSDVTLFQGTYAVYSLVALGGLIVEAMSRRDQDCDWTDKSILEKSHAALRQTFFAAGAIVFFTMATKDRLISRFFLFTYLPMLYVLFLLTARTLPDSAIHFLFHRYRQQKTLLVGPTKTARSLKLWLDGKKLLGFEIVGVLSNDVTPCPADLPHLGWLDDFQTVASSHQISHVILVEPPSDAHSLTKIVSDCERLGLRLLVVSDLQEKFRHRVIYMEAGGRHFIALREEPLENPVNRGLKRLLDIAIALPAFVLILPPACALIWVLQRLQSPGPLFYVQERVGIQNRPFQIIKFRTMRVGKQDNRQATAHDGRIFPAGRWMRKFSLDELPQFWNVLRGQMSVVGPRPHLRVHNDQFSHVLSNYHIRSLVKPGITGLAQVRGFRGEALDQTLLRKRIESDLYYVENWSFAADLIIIARTVWQIVRPPKTAY
jgi:exopolysaccharide biosynthesis polyprenyl glycosylphosphotransferase